MAIDFRESLKQNSNANKRGGQWQIEKLVQSEEFEKDLLEFFMLRQNQGEDTATIRMEFDFDFATADEKCKLFFGHRQYKELEATTFKDDGNKYTVSTNHLSNQLKEFGVPFVMKEEAGNAVFTWKVALHFD